MGANVLGAAVGKAVGTPDGAHEGVAVGAMLVGAPVVVVVNVSVSVTMLLIPEKSSSLSSAVEIAATNPVVEIELKLETLPTPPEATKVCDVLFATIDTSNDSGGDRELYQLSNSALYIAAMLACCGAESTWENAIVLVTVPVTG